MRRSLGSPLLAAFVCLCLAAPQAHGGAIGIGPVPDGSKPAEALAPRIAEVMLDRIAGPLEHPWSIAFLPDGGILVTEKPGRLRLVHQGELLPEPVAGVPEVLFAGHGGLLDVVLDPDHASNGLLYFSYIHGTEEAAAVRIMRAQLEGMRLTGQEVIFESHPPVSGADQFGGRLAIGSDGLLYATMGDRFRGGPAQDLGDHAGSIVRIKRDGHAPEDNPFLGFPGALSEIFTIGHRNPQGLAFEPAGKRLWAVEHGPQGGDELNVIRAGRNYGWPEITYGMDYDGTPIGIGVHAPGMEQPIHYWVPSVAPSGMTFYEGDLFPDWRGKLLVSTLSGQLLLLDLGEDAVIAQQAVIEGSIGRIRDVRSGPDGFVYLVNDAPDGGLYRMGPAFDQAVYVREHTTATDPDVPVIDPFH